MESVAYVLCGITALACAVLLLRGYRRKKFRLLLWCSLFFFAVTLENMILFVDLVLIPQVDLSLYRKLVALAGLLVLLYGLIWETK